MNLILKVFPSKGQLVWDPVNASESQWEPVLDLWEDIVTIYPSPQKSFPALSLLLHTLSRDVNCSKIQHLGVSVVLPSENCTNPTLQGKIQCYPFIQFICSASFGQGERTFEWIMGCTFFVLWRHQYCFRRYFKSDAPVQKGSLSESVKMRWETLHIGIL